MNTQPNTLAPAATGRPMSPKEFGEHIGRSARWVRTMCALKKIPTCPPKRRPYLIPRNVLFKFGVLEQ
jgi:hypothetical protein